MGADAHFGRPGYAFAVYERPKPRIRIINRAAATAKSKFGVLARNHRPLLLRKGVMTDSRVTSDQPDVTRERVLAMQFTIAILCENQFHRCQKPDREGGPL